MKIKKTSFIFFVIVTFLTIFFIGCNNYSCNANNSPIDEITVTPLSPPRNPTIQNNILSWWPISMANGYTIRIQCSQFLIEPIYQISRAGAGTSFNLTQLNLPTGTYYISIRSNRRYFDTIIFDYSIFTKPIVFVVM